MIKYLHENISMEAFGNKAEKLSVLIANGINVPSGFCISKKYQEKYISNIKDIEEELSQYLKSLTSEKIMVRSSAIGEDSEDASFAGQLSSYISNNDLDDVLSKLQKCWQSYNDNTVNSYQNNKGMRLNGMGVIVQEMIDPDKAGVLFTKSPIHSDGILIEYVDGHAEKLVSGEVNPKSIHVVDNTHSDDINIQSLIEISNKIKSIYSSEQDIEWAEKNNEIFIVQTRPITHNNDELKFYWSNTNLNENYPDKISPMLYSIARDSYYFYFKNLANLLKLNEEDIASSESDFSNVVGIHDSYIYYNMTSIHNIFTLSPFSAILIKSFDNFVGYDEQSRTAKSPSKANKISFIYSIIKLYNKLETNIRTFEDRVDRHSILPSKTLSDLRNRIHDFIEIRMHSWFKASLADFFAMIFNYLLEKWCNRYGKNVHSKLIQAIPGLISARPGIDAWHIAQYIKENEQYRQLFKRDSNTILHELEDVRYSDVRVKIERYLQEWGFRCSGELMFSTENYIDAPETFIEMLKTYINNDLPDPEKVINEKQEESNLAQKNIIKDIYKKRGILFIFAYLEVFILKQLKKYTIKSISSRERARLKQAKLYHEYKKTCREYAKHLKASDMITEIDDVFKLTYKELQEIASDSYQFPEQIKNIIKSRSEYKFTDKEYDNFYSYRKYGDRKLYKLNTINSQSRGALRGLSACSGIVTGRVRVLHSVKEISKIKQGDILVTRQTDPGWAAVFPLLKGLLVERGGVLSHGAIVAREFGIPAIVGIPNLTSIINDNDIVTINAFDGEVTIEDND